jgi:SpoVK/Ycf46/Vps4 family AAA+-type ATPase
MIALQEHVSKYKSIEEARKHASEIKVTAKDFDKALEKTKPSGHDGKDYGKII